MVCHKRSNARLGAQRHCHERPKLSGRRRSNHPRRRNKGHEFENGQYRNERHLETHIKERQRGEKQYKKSGKVKVTLEKGIAAGKSGHAHERTHYGSPDKRYGHAGNHSVKPHKQYYSHLCGHTHPAKTPAERKKILKQRKYYAKVQTGQGKNMTCARVRKNIAHAARHMRLFAQSHCRHHREKVPLKPGVAVKAHQPQAYVFAPKHYAVAQTETLPAQSRRLCGGQGHNIVGKNESRAANSVKFQKRSIVELIRIACVTRFCHFSINHNCIAAFQSINAFGAKNCDFRIAVHAVKNAPFVNLGNPYAKSRNALPQHGTGCYNSAIGSLFLRPRVSGFNKSVRRSDKTKNEEKQNGGNEKPEVFHPPFV